MLVIKITLGADSFVFKGTYDQFDSARELLTEWYRERKRTMPTILGTLEFSAPTEQPAP